MLEGRQLIIERPEQLVRAQTRRDFLRVLGLGGSIVLLPAVFAACNDDDTSITQPNGTVTNVVLDLSTDAGLMNFLFLNEQVEAAFYNAAVASSAFGGMTAEQREVISDIRAVENIHREFFRSVLGSNGIGYIVLNESNIASATSSAASILRFAEMLEDNGVATNNGVGKYFQSADNLALGGKLVSVEARHVAAIRDLREAAGISATGVAAGTRFAGDDIVVSSGPLAGLDTKVEPAVGLSRLLSTGFASATISVGTNPPAKTGTTDSPPPTPTP
jgi:hypothetical protein